MVAKNAISTIAKTKPKTNNAVSSLAMAATATTLSKDIEISATAIVNNACENCCFSVSFSDSSVFTSVSNFVPACRISLKKRQQTNAKSSPPKINIPGI